MIRHTFLTWLFTCTAGTLLLAGATAVWDGSELGGSEFGQIALIAFLITLATSIPAMILYGFLGSTLLSQMPHNRVKAILSGYGFVTTAITCLITFGPAGLDLMRDETDVLLLLCLPYGVAFAASPWVIPMPERGYALREGSAPAATIGGGTPAYTFVATVSVLELLYMLSQVLTQGLLSSGTMPFLIWFFADITILGIALFLFIRWKTPGWNLLTALSAAGIAGLLATVYNLADIGRQYGARVGRAFLVPILFGVAQIIVLWTLSRPSLRARFNRSMQDYGMWAGIGLGWAVLRILLSKVLH